MKERSANGQIQSKQGRLRLRGAVGLSERVFNVRKWGGLGTESPIQWGWHKIGMLIRHFSQPNNDLVVVR